MQNQRLHAPQGRADVSPELHLSMAGGGFRGLLLTPVLNSRPQRLRMCGTRNGPVGGVKYVSLWQTCDMYIPGKPRSVQ